MFPFPWKITKDFNQKKASELGFIVYQSHAKHLDILINAPRITAREMTSILIVDETEAQQS